MATVKKRIPSFKHIVYRKKKGRGIRSLMNKTRNKDKDKINFSDLFEPNEEQQSEEEVQKTFTRAYAETLDDWEGDIQ